MAENTSLITQLTDALATVKTPGSFFVEGRRKVPMPLLEINGLGPIAFPLLPAQAQDLRALCEPAPYGRGQLTQVDTQVRRTWQLSPEQFSLHDPDFDRLIQELVQQVQHGLGVEGQVTAELYKLLMYDEGSFFVPHRDTEKAPGMFGTLVVALPAVHGGGELVIRHHGVEATLTLNPTHPSELRFAAFFADCEHEVRPITSGYRLVLIFNLLLKTGTSRQAPNYSVQEAAISSLLDTWRTQNAAPTKLMVVLEHRYSAEGLSWAGLKGRDAGIASVLRAAGRQSATTVSLAQISIEEQGSATERYSYPSRSWRRAPSRQAAEEEFEVIEVYERSCEVGGWLDPHDHPLAMGPLSFEEDELCPADALDDAKPDSQAYMEATGNEGASFERTYRFASIVLWPETRLVEVLAQGDPGSTLALIEQWATSPDKAAIMGAAELTSHLMHRLESANARSDTLTHEELNRLMQTTLSTGNQALIERVVHFIAQRATRFLPLGPVLARGIAALGWNRAAALLPNLLEKQVQTQFHGCVTCFHTLCEAVTPEAAVGRATLLNLGGWLIERIPEPTIGDSRSVDRLSSDTLTALLKGFHLIQAEELLQQLAQRLVSDQTRSDDVLLLPTLEALPHELLFSPSLAPLLMRVKLHLKQRIALPLSAPVDWTRDSDVGCTCTLCIRLKQFLQSPVQETLELKIKRQDRDHVSNQVRHAQLDVETTVIERGNPHILRCRKTTTRYKLRCTQRSDDLQHLARLEP